MSRFSLPANRDWTLELQNSLADASDPVWLFDPEQRRILWANGPGLQLWRAESIEEVWTRDFRRNREALGVENLDEHLIGLRAGEVCIDRWRISQSHDLTHDVDVLMTRVHLPSGRFGVLTRTRRAEDNPDHVVQTPPSNAVDLTRSELERMVLARTEELTVERDQFDRTFETVSALVLLVDHEGTIVRANAWARSVLDEPSLVGRSVHTTCGFPDRSQLSNWFAAGQAPADAVEVFLQPRTNQRVHILWTPRISASPSTPGHLVLTGLDITQLRDVETQLQVTDRMATIGTLAAGIAHDLNNPLAYITSNAEMLMEELARLGQKELHAMAQDCLEGARRAASIVGQLRTFARGGASGAKGIAQVRSVLEFAARMAHNHVKHHAQVDWRCPPDLYASIDESKLGQVVLNLIIHAVESIDPGKASNHHVEIVATAGEEGWMSISVEDDGDGLSAEHLRRIFDPYASPHLPPQSASGMSLAICHRIITDVGGRVEVTSQDDTGNRVQVWLPSPNRRTSENLASSVPRPVSKTKNITFNSGMEDRPRVLVVDDEPGLRSVMRRALKEFDLDEAVDGRQALELLESNVYSAILCDIMMPEMTGVELYETVQMRWPDQAARFVFLSGGAFTADTQRFLDLTQRLVIDKPFRMDQLRRAVTKIIARNSNTN